MKTSQYNANFKMQSAKALFIHFAFFILQSSLFTSTFEECR